MEMTVPLVQWSAISQMQLLIDFTTMTCCCSKKLRFLCENKRTTIVSQTTQHSMAHFSKKSFTNTNNPTLTLKLDRLFPASQLIYFLWIISINLKSGRLTETFKNKRIMIPMLSHNKDDIQCSKHQHLLSLHVLCSYHYSDCHFTDVSQISVPHIYYCKLHLIAENFMPSTVPNTHFSRLVKLFRYSPDFAWSSATCPASVDSPSSWNLLCLQQFPFDGLCERRFDML